LCLQGILEPEASANDNIENAADPDDNPDPEDMDDQKNLLPSSHYIGDKYLWEMTEKTGPYLSSSNDNKENKQVKRILHPTTMMFVVRFCYHRTIPMMRNAAYYVSTIEWALVAPWIFARFSL
jgi:hypothetical protein